MKPKRQLARCRAYYATRSYIIHKKRERGLLDHAWKISSSYFPDYLKKQNIGYAAARLDIYEIKHIIKLGVKDINVRSDFHHIGYPEGDKSTALYLVLRGSGNQSNKFPAFKLIADAGADINQKVYNQSLIQLASSLIQNPSLNGPETNGKGEMEILKLLICRGANITHKCNAVNEAISQLFSKYKTLLIAVNDKQSSLHGIPSELLTSISVIATVLSYAKETPKKKVAEVAKNEVKKCEQKEEESICAIM